jgi:hypothetical protein
MVTFHWLRFGQNVRGAEDREILRGRWAAVGDVTPWIGFQGIARFLDAESGHAADFRGVRA